MPARWKTCLFHPVWAAISAILFLGALLMPHSNRRPDVYPNSPPSRFPSSPIRHLPPFQSGDKNPAPAVYAQPKPPILAEAAESLDFPLKGDPVFILPFPSGESPILLKRPRAVDTRQLALDLAVLAGLQIGGGEWGDAGESIDLLRRYSPETAGKLGEMLTAALAESQVSLDS
ncbi:MAG: hypothetical protein LBU64_08915, partial [Planctomycetota bacterium]|nr:hypothetical protein [Planctomycetota bacterium]